MPRKLQASSSARLPIPVELIEHRIYLVRGQKVMLDGHLAELYQVPTKDLKRAVRRNRDRFPDDFMLELTLGEAAALRSQFGALDKGRGRYFQVCSLRLHRARSGNALLGAQ